MKIEFLLLPLAEYGQQSKRKNEQILLPEYGEQSKQKNEQIPSFFPLLA